MVPAVAECRHGEPGIAALSVPCRTRPVAGSDDKHVNLLLEPSGGATRWLRGPMVIIEAPTTGSRRAAGPVGPTGISRPGRTAG
jgi:hypothetical protein